jgi:ATP-binding cassette subfamily F protein uup
MAAYPPLIRLRGARVGFGGPPVFDNVDVRVGRGERICLVGRNGSGKSTLMKVLTQAIELDAGELYVHPGITVSYLPQEPEFDPDETVLDHVEDRAPSHHEAEAMVDRFELDPGALLGSLSGGEGRRVALARAFVGTPEILLLDEPTNHLDLATIERLERMLAGYPGGVLIVSHDRAFLANVSDRTLWLDRGHVQAIDRGFAGFDEWSEEVLDAEEKALARLDQKLVEETRWLRRGVTARRRRNLGRLRRLEEMRAVRATIIGDRAGVRAKIADGEIKSRLVIDAENISKSFATGYGERVIVSEFTTRILRGDRIGIIGANGSGKTTLLKLLTGELAPDSGRVRLAKRMHVAYFDQRRSQLDGSKTLWETLCPGGGDSVMVRGHQRHVVGYLKDFLFAVDQVKSPVASLSGGERNRLLLAKILASPADLLVLDEPTNDLDMDTLELLEEMLGDYEGTLLLVSHDRDFLERLVTSTIATEGEGEVREYAGGYISYLAQRGDRSRKQVGGKARPGRGTGKPANTARPAAPRLRLGYKDERALSLLPDEMDALTKEIGGIEARLGDGALYARDPALFEAEVSQLADARAALAAAEERWLELELMREEAESGAGDQGDAAGAVE